MALATPFPASIPAQRPAHRPAHRPAQRPAQRPASRPAAPIRLTRRGKALATLACSLLAFTVLQGTGALEAAAGAVTGGPATASVVVEPGESLWGISQRVAPEADPRSTILLIRELNGLGSADVLRAGQSLVVPV